MNLPLFCRPPYSTLNDNTHSNLFSTHHSNHLLHLGMKRKPPCSLRSLWGLIKRDQNLTLKHQTVANSKSGFSLRSCFLPTPPCTAPTLTSSVAMPCQVQRCKKQQNIQTCCRSSDCKDARKVGLVTRGSRGQLHSDRSLLRPVSPRIQLQIRLSPPLPQLHPQAV